VTSVSGRTKGSTKKGYDPVVGALGWIAVAGVALLAVGLWRRKRRGGAPDVGPVSDNWLAEQRGRKN
jgi:hypothetical protein